MENKILTPKEIESFKKRGIDPFSNAKIIYRFTISVNTKRLDFFEMFYNKFLGDNMILSSNQTTFFQKKYVFSKLGKTESFICSSKKTDEKTTFTITSPPKVLISDDGPTKTYENIIVDGVPYTRMKFEFTNCHPFVVAKVITDLTDCVNFTSDIYGYDTDGNEILLIKYPIGTVVNIKNSGNSDIDYIVSGYNYERDINEFTYVIKRFEDGEIMGMMNISEERIKPSRGNNLDILLGLN